LVYFADIQIYGEEEFMKMIQEIKNEIEGLKARKACVVKERGGQDIPCSN